MVSPVNNTTSSITLLSQAQPNNSSITPLQENHAANNNETVKNTVEPAIPSKNSPKTSSETFSALLAAQEDRAESNTTKKTPRHTAQALGQSVDLDDYFSNTPKKTSGSPTLFDMAQQILLPTSENVKALSEHAEQRFQSLLSEYNIPSAPEKITYNNAGQMILPEDYAYKDELRHALKENPGLERELSTLNALTSHAIGLERSLAFNEQYSKATTKAQADAIIAQFSDLFSKNRQENNIALSFTDSGKLNILINGETTPLFG